MKYLSFVIKEKDINLSFINYNLEKYKDKLNKLYYSYL